MGPEHETDRRTSRPAPANGRRSRSSRLAEERRSAILAAAAELLVERGYRGTSMRAIAHAAEIDTASLYHYFASKDELVFELVSHLYAERLDDALAAEAGADPVERIRRFSRRHFLGLAERFDAVAIAYRDDAHLTAPRRRRLQQERERYVATFRELIEEGRRSGDVADDVVPELAAVGLLGMAFVMCERVASHDEQARAAAAEAYTAMVVRSLVAPGAPAAQVLQEDAPRASSSAPTTPARSPSAGGTRNSSRGGRAT